MKTTFLPFRHLCFVLFLYAGFTSCSDDIYYVKPTGSDSNNGSNWNNAFQTLEKAMLNCDSDGDQIWVAAGTYKPNAVHGGSTNRHKTFFINKNIKFFGGFAGTESRLSQRNLTANVTILSGDLGTEGDNTDNAYHVVWVDHRSGNMVLDGFTIEKGNANGAVPADRGGGIYNDGGGGSSNFLLVNCIFSNNLASIGGGLYNEGSGGNCSPNLSNCHFSGNSAATGGGIYNDGAGGASSPSLTNCTFAGNSASAGGAGIYNDGSGGGASSPSLTNCAFSGNSATDGGGMYNDGSSGVCSPGQTNCSFSGNNASGAGGAVRNENAAPVLTNCILWGNSSEIENTGSGSPSVTYSIVQQASGVFPGTGNLNVNPLFILQPPVGLGTSGNLHLQAASPAVNAGTGPGAPGFDFDGDSRPYGAGFDMGFDEVLTGISCPGGSVIYVDASAPAGGNGASWAAAFQNLQPALNMAKACPGVLEIWVADGTYNPTSQHCGFSDRHKTFFIDFNIKIYGGFAGGETMLSQRNWTTNLAKLSGDLGTVDDSTDNAYHVVWLHRRPSAMQLDGFIIEKGNANEATSELGNLGGGIYNDGKGSGNSSNPTIANCTFSQNSARVGGGMFNDGFGGGTASPSLTNCIFSGNFAAGYGGGMCNTSQSGGTSSPSLTNCTFSANNADSGGGMYNDGKQNGNSSPSLTNCSFTGNSVTGTNSGFYSQLGGGMYNDGALGVSSPMLINCTFTGNIATVGGGGMYNNGASGISSPSLTLCIFSGNSADYGGGMFNDGSLNGNCSPSLSRCTFSGNTATTEGGGLYNVVGYINNPGICSPSFVNCSFSGNLAETGAGMMNALTDQGTCTPSLTNCSFSGNHATMANGGGAMKNDKSATTLKNCILWGNSTEIINLNGGSATVTYSIVQGGYAGTGNLNIDPLFVNQPSFTAAPTTAANLHLRVNSPAKNAATSSGAPAIDIDGDARPQAGGFDMGCDEFVCPAGTKIYVDANIPASGNGTSWASAFQNLQFALDLAKGCSGFQEIWVAAGTYLPTATHGGSTDRHKTFFIDVNIKIYGGFAGGETLLSQRNWTANPTILSGDLGTVGNFSDNAYHVVWIENRTSAMQLDGFTIEKGNSNLSSGLETLGGGIYNVANGSGSSSNPTIANCIISGNYASNQGGGMINRSDNGTGTCSPTLTNCMFISNTAGNYGGGLFNRGASGSVSSPTLSKCIFLGNKSNASSGGAIFNQGFQGNSSPSLVNCAFLGNTAQGDGGAVANDGSSGGICNASFVNCSFSGNSAAGGGGVMINYQSGANTTVKNCILWGNNSAIYNVSGTSTVTYSIVQGGYSGTGNLNTDPLFISQPPVGLGTSGDLHLRPTSPALDVGTATGAPATDFDGDPRPVNAGFDMGFDERTKCQAGAVVFVDASAPAGGSGTSWAAAVQSLQTALELAKYCPGITEIWVADGTYKPSVAQGGSTDRHKTFFIHFDVKIYGGFAGGETMLSQRNWTTNPTILSGDLGNAGNNNDNAYHVVWLHRRTSAMWLDGFTIEKGNANGTAGVEERGGGIYNDGSGAGNSSNPAIANCTFSNNSTSINGGAIYNDGRNGGISSPSLTNCTFTGNSAQYAGAVYNHGQTGGTSSPSFTNCTFTGNSAGDRGGALYNQGHEGTSNPTILNCTFSGNSATNQGGAIRNQGTGGGTSNPALTNCIFIGNSSSAGGAIHSDGSTGTSSSNFVNCSFSGNTAPTGGVIRNFASVSTLTNCILWGNSSAISNTSGGSSAVTYSIVQGSHAGTGNLDINPQFISQPPVGLGTTGNLYLQACSPAADVGSDAANATTTDLDGNPRKVDAITGGAMIDLGAYEYQGDLDVDNDGYTYCGGLDCNDNNANIHPGGTEICNGLDDDCDGNPESAVTTWTGLGDGMNWSSGGNWSDGFVPLPCQDVVIPAAGNVTVPAGFTAVGKTLEVAVGAILTTNPTGQVDIHN